jgi:hypothetical protein
MALQARLIDWNEPAERAIEKARATPELIAQWKADQDDHKSHLWEFSGDAVGYMVTRVEKTATGLELVLVAASGENARPVIRWAMNMATQYGFQSIRTHITRPGLQRIYEAEGWHEKERILEVTVDGR